MDVLILPPVEGRFGGSEPGETREDLGRPVEGRSSLSGDGGEVGRRWEGGLVVCGPAVKEGGFLRGSRKIGRRAILEGVPSEPRYVSGDTPVLLCVGGKPRYTSGDMFPVHISTAATDVVTARLCSPASVYSRVRLCFAVARRRETGAMTTPSGCPSTPEPAVGENTAHLSTPKRPINWSASSSVFAAALCLPISPVTVPSMTSSVAQTPGCRAEPARRRA
mmetsp:Transcript_19687/g.46995  ORF Transcript_19687/g.46995 Transcript_19687/m.46995 type:complete len:221 (+) Transcript_19687:339-1001(+)